MWLVATTGWLPDNTLCMCSGITRHIRASLDVRTVQTMLQWHPSEHGIRTERGL